MRRLALAALCLSFFAVGCETKPAAPATPAPAAGETKTSSNSTADVQYISTVTLKVPTMSCPHGCWPTVKETLEKQEGVAAVELAAQTEADTIDKPEVLVKLKSDFNSKAAIEALSAAGFDNAEVLN